METNVITWATLPIMMSLFIVAAVLTIRQTFHKNSDEEMFRKLVTNNSPALKFHQRQALLRLLLIFGLAGLVLNFLFIRFLPQYANSTTSKKHLYVAVDNSLSMNVKDASGLSRLDAVKKKLGIALSGADISHTNLVTFHSYPTIYPETDSKTAAERLADIQPVQYFATKGSSFSSLFSGLVSDITSKKKLSPDDTYYLVVISDGEQTAQTSGDFNTELGNLRPLLSGVSIFGVGTEAGGPVSFNAYDTRFLSSGAVTMTPTSNISSLDAQTLQQIAASNKTTYKTLNDTTKPSDILPNLPADTPHSSASAYYFYWPFSVLCFLMLLTYLVLPYLNRASTNKREVDHETR